ncbi:hypothetical protein [Variovorax sp. GB4R4]|uniref:hypothetical protein n=1 Tax=Variovorax sp. GB4R4 TaxID=3443739 RepID=UPI003F4956BE
MILEYIKVVLSWPPMAVLLVWILLPTFGVPLATLLKNIRKGKAAGIEFEVDPEKQQGSAPPPLVAEDHLGRIAADPKAAKAEILKWWTAAVAENNFHKIYGTQMRLMEHLANRPNGADSEGNLLPFHLEHLKLVEAASNPIAPGYWTQYFGFLLHTEYVERVADSNQVRLTPLGQEFLRYIRSTWGAFASNRPL